MEFPNDCDSLFADLLRMFFLTGMKLQSKSRLTMKSVWLVNLFFGEGVAPTGFLLESLAVKLQEQGWLVEVLTGQVGYNAAQTGVRQRFSGKVVHLGNRLISAAGF